MSVQNVDNKNTGVQSLILNSLAGGAVASEIHRALLPAETRAALKNTSRGIDNFVKKSQKAAEKTMKKTGKTFDLNKIAENAKNMYPEMKEIAVNASKKLNKTFAVTAIAIASGTVVSGLFMKAKNQKADKVSTDK